MRWWSRRPQDVTISAGIDAGQPWRRCHGDNITYTDWQRDNYWRAILSVTGPGRVIGYEGDHLTLVQSEKLNAFLTPSKLVDVAPATMKQRMMKSAAEIALITHGANVADVGGYAIREAVKVGAREIDVAMAGRDAMELEIAKRFPEAEYRDTWVWFQSGINTDGAHNPVTARECAGGRYPEPQHLSDDLGLLHRAGAHDVRARGGRGVPEDLGGERGRP